MMISAQNALKFENFRVEYATLGIATVTIAVFELALPIVTLQVYDRVLPNVSHGTLAILLIGAFVALCLDIVLRFVRARLIGVYGGVHIHGLSCVAVERILNQDSSQTKRSGTGERLNAISAIRTLREFHSGYSFITIIELMMTPLLLALLAIIGGPLAIGPGILLVIFIWMTRRNGQHLRDAMEARNTHDDERYDFLIEKLGGLHTVKAMSLETQTARSYEELKFTSGVHNHDVAISLTRAFNRAAFFSSLITYSTVALGALMALLGSLSAGGLIACILLSGRLMPPVQRALALYARRQDYLVAKGEVEQLLDVPSVATEPVDDNDDLASTRNDGHLILKDVGFSYSGSTPLLKGVDLEISVGDTLVLSGRAGSGRTTLLKLLAGVYPPQEGKILLNGQDSRYQEPHQLTSQVGFMPTRGEIYRGSILDNMSRFGGTPIPDVMYVARLLGVDKDVAKLPGGFETQLQGIGSDAIPPGLKQRIAIVRALAPRPKLLIFDNADLALDRASYAAVYKLLSQVRSQVAMVLVTEDTFLRGLATRHIELVNGALVSLPVPSQRDLKVQGYRELRV